MDEWESQSAEESWYAMHSLARNPTHELCNPCLKDPSTNIGAKLEASLASLPWPPPQEVAGILVQPCCKLGFSFEVLHVYSSQRRRLCALLFTLRFPYAGKLVVCVRPLLEKSCWRASPRHQGLIVNTELSPPFTDEIADVDVHSCTCIA